MFWVGRARLAAAGAWDRASYRDRLVISAFARSADKHCDEGVALPLFKCENTSLVQLDADLGIWLDWTLLGGRQRSLSLCRHFRFGTYTFTLH